MSSAAHGSLLLDSLELPADLQRLEVRQLAALAAEVRAALIRDVATPERLAAGLAAVELAIAVHHVFDASSDRIVWDHGADSLAHAVLSGRRHPLHGGHCGTAIGTALGMAVAATRLGEPRHVVAIVGDGALTAGMAFEGLNHAGALPADMLVILNDSDPARSAGGSVLSDRLAQVLSGPLYAQLRASGKRVLRQMPTVRELARRSERHLKGMVLPGTMFEELGFNYIGPLDGHNIGALVATLRNLKRLRGPQFLHVLTRKGEPPVAGSLRSGPPGEARARGGYSQAVGRWLADMAQADPRIMVVAPCGGASSGLDEFAQRFPERCLDVSIAQQHAVTLAAGLAVAGLKPVVAISSTALQRAYDQLIHDVALQGLPVIFAVSHAGLSAGDPGSDHGTYDLSYLRCVPNLTIMAPADENECRQMLDTAHGLPGPAVVRFPCGHGPRLPRTAAAVVPGRGLLCHEGGSGLGLLSFGALLDAVADTAERLDATLVNMRFVKPLDEDLLLSLCARHRALVTIEDNVIAGGAGAGVLEWLAARGLRIPLLQLGVDGCGERGVRTSALAAARLTAAALGRDIERWWRSLS